MDNIQLGEYKGIATNANTKGQKGLVENLATKASELKRPFGSFKVMFAGNIAQIEEDGEVAVFNSVAEANRYVQAGFVDPAEIKKEWMDTFMGACLELGFDPNDIANAKIEKAFKEGADPEATADLLTDEVKKDREAKEAARLEKEAEKKAKEEEKKKKEADEAKRVQDLKQVESDIVNNVTKGLNKIVTAEKKAINSANSVRWSKGEILYEGKKLIAKAKELSSKRFSNEGGYIALIQETFKEAGIQGVSLSKTEVSMTSKAYEAWAKDFGGVDSKFTSPFTLDLDTSSAIFEPAEMDLSNIPVLKAYYLADLVTPENRDWLAAFAYHFPQNVVQEAAKLLFDGSKDNIEAAVREYLESFNSKAEAEDDEDKQLIDIRSTEAFNTFLQETNRRKKQTPEFKNTKMYHDDYEGLYGRIRHFFADFVASNNMTEAKLDDPTLLHVLLTVFDPQAHDSEGNAVGIDSLYSAILDSGYGTQEQTALHHAKLRGVELGGAVEGEAEA